MTQVEGATRPGGEGKLPTAVVRQGTKPDEKNRHQKTGKMSRSADRNIATTDLVRTQSPQAVRAAITV